MLSLAMMFTMFTMYFGVTSYATEQRSAGSDETAAVITADAVLLAANKGWQPKPTRTVKSASEFPITLKNGANQRPHRVYGIRGGQPHYACGGRQCVNNYKRQRYAQGRRCFRDDGGNSGHQGSCGSKAYRLQRSR